MWVLQFSVTGRSLLGKIIIIFSELCKDGKLLVPKSLQEKIIYMKCCLSASSEKPLHCTYSFGDHFDIAFNQYPQSDPYEGCLLKFSVAEETGNSYLGYLQV